MPKIRLQNLVKRYGNTQVLYDINSALFYVMFICLVLMTTGAVKG